MGTQRIHCYITKLHHKASVETSFSVFRSFALTALMSEWMSSPYSDRESSVSYDDVISYRIPWQMNDLHRSSGGRDCEGLRAKVLSLLTVNVENEDHLLLGVLGRRQLAPLCRM